MNIKFLIAGEGGQGVQTIAKIISNAANQQGQNITYIPSFGVEQRGTPSIAFITIGHDPIFYPRFEAADYVVVLQKRAIHSISRHISPNTKVIFDSSTIDHRSLPKRVAHLFGTPATEYAVTKFSLKTLNIIITGKVAQILDLPKDIVWKNVLMTLGKKFKTDEIRRMNQEAFDFGYNLVFETKNYSKNTHSPSEDVIIVSGFGKKGQIVPKRCKGCGICIEKCPVRALKFGEVLGVFASPTPEVDLERCIACGNCRRFCPDGAISIMKK